MIIYVDPFAKIVEESELGLPSGWIIPPTDISLDIVGEPLPYGVVIACSSKESYNIGFERKKNAFCC